MNEAMTMPTSLTIASSIALRLRCLAPRIHALGVRPLYEFLCEVAGGADPVSRAEAYATLTLHADLIEAYGGTDLPPAIWRVK
jgi:hypothetical protein